MRSSSHRTRSLIAGAALLLLAGCAASAPAGSAAREIEVTIDGYHFVPDHVEVRQGESVRFLVSNPDDIAHELYIGTIQEQAARREEGAMAPSNDAVTHFGYGIYLPAFSDGEFDYVFNSDADLLIGCHLPGHWEAGMVATIAVAP